MSIQVPSGSTESTTDSLPDTFALDALLRQRTEHRQTMRELLQSLQAGQTDIDAVVAALSSPPESETPVYQAYPFRHGTYRIDGRAAAVDRLSKSCLPSLTLRDALNQGRVAESAATDDYEVQIQWIQVSKDMDLAALLSDLKAAGLRGVNFHEFDVLVRGQGSFVATEAAFTDVQGTEKWIAADYPSFSINAVDRISAGTPVPVVVRTVSKGETAPLVIQAA